MSNRDDQKGESPTMASMIPFPSSVRRLRWRDMCPESAEAAPTPTAPRQGANTLVAHDIRSVEPITFVEGWGFAAPATRLV